MRVYLAQIVPLCILTASVASAAPTFPYKAYVTAEDVYVRSGPGKSYYPTAKLPAGTEVDVFRHDPGGWCAIKPMKGEFTWVASRFLKPLGDGLAEVTRDRIAARVGSRFSDIRDVIQVRLHQGEVVEILEEKASPAGSGDQKWYRIAPPSGEFRWVSGKFVDPDYPRDGVRKASSKDSPLVQQNSAADQHTQGARQKEEAPQSRAPAPPASGGTSVSEPVAQKRGVRQSMSRSLSPEEFEQELADLDMELSIMVAEEPTVWSFEELAMRGRSLLAQAETAVERGRARVVVGKVARFANIKQRYDTVDTMVAKTERRNHRLAVLSRSRTSDRSVRSDDRFDGQGRLTRVVSPKPGAPRYALVDEGGDVRCYVTPAPGVNLRYYIGRDVGVSGIRGYMPEQRAHHVMAKQVNPLEGTRLR